MKEVTRVHLAKTPYSIEVDAKKVLERYLKDIERVMNAEPEAMREIEARMVELLAERGVKADGVVTDADVQALRQQMGEPTAFSDSEEEPELLESEDEPASERSTKRLMRDPDNAIFGGVCAGIAAYLGINPLWIRLLAIISPFLTVGTAILVYIVLWISMPPARTAAEKLQMRGELVTLEALKRLSISESAASQSKNIAGKIGRAILGVTFLVVAFGLTIGLIVGGTAGVGIVSSLDGFSAQNWAWGMWASLAIGGLSAIGLAILLAQSSFIWKIKKLAGMAMIVMLTILAFSISSVAIFGMQTAKHFQRDEKRLTRVVPVELPDNLDGVKYVEPSGPLLVDIDRRGDKIGAEVQYIAAKGVNPPKVTVSRDGDTLRFKVDESYFQEDCSSFFLTGWRDCSFRSASIRFSGPIEVKSSDEGSSVDRSEIPDQD